VDRRDDVDGTVARHHRVDERAGRLRVGQVAAVDVGIADVSGAPRHLLVVRRPARTDHRGAQLFEARGDRVCDAHRARHAGDECDAALQGMVAGHSSRNLSLPVVTSSPIRYLRSGAGDS
jgi:hypothetical protein